MSQTKIRNEQLDPIESESLKNTVGFRAYISSAQAVARGSSDTLVAYAVEEYDTGGDYTNTASNYKFTAPVTGIYSISADLHYQGNSSGIVTYPYVRLYKNGSFFLYRISEGGAVFSDVQFVDTVKLTSGDYLQVYARHLSASADATVLGSFSVRLVGTV